MSKDRVKLISLAVFEFAVEILIAAILCYQAELYMVLPLYFYLAIIVAHIHGLELNGNTLRNAVIVSTIFLALIIIFQLVGCPERNLYKYSAAMFSTVLNNLNKPESTIGIVIYNIKTNVLNIV